MASFLASAFVLSSYSFLSSFFNSSIFSFSSISFTYLSSIAVALSFSVMLALGTTMVLFSSFFIVILISLGFIYLEDSYGISLTSSSLLRWSLGIVSGTLKTLYSTPGTGYVLFNSALSSFSFCLCIFSLVCLSWFSRFSRYFIFSSFDDVFGGGFGSCSTASSVESAVLAGKSEV